MCEWRSAIDPGYACRVPAEPGSSLCIFHEPGDKDRARFQQALDSQINEDGPAEKRNKRYSFLGYVFPSRVVAGTPAFPDESIELPPAIEDDAWFSRATIEGDASFDDAKFKGSAWFSGTTIKGDADFDNAVIEWDAWFGGVTIEGSAWFADARIGWGAGFGGARIDGNACFAGATIGDANFYDATIKGGVDFAGATIEGNAQLLGFVCGGLWLGTGLPRIRGWGDARCGVIIARPEAAVAFWRFAQRIFSDTGERHKADAAFYFERLNMWRLLRQGKADGNASWPVKWWRNWIIRPAYWVLFLLDLLFVRWPTAYGASIARIFATWAVLIGGFASIYYALILCGVQLFASESPGLQFPFSFGRALYFSVITFTTLGYGDIQPAPGVGSGLCATEAILGGIMMALTVLVIGRKFMR
jgi:hypothetical protein